METALIVLVLSVVMVVGGRLLMLYERRSKYEGLLSCALGVCLTTTWSAYYPGDFDDLGDFIVRRLGYMVSSDPLPILMLAMIPASITFVVLTVVHYSDSSGPRSIRTVFGPLGRVRRPRVLR